MKNGNRAAGIRSIMMGNKAFLIVIGLSIILSFASPVFLKSSNLLNVVRQVCVSTLLSIGFTIGMSAGYMDLSIGTLMGLCGMILAKLVKEAGMPLGPAIVIVICIAMCGGIFNALIVTLFKVPAFIVTLATQSIFKGINYIISNLVPISGLPDDLIFLGQGYLLGVPIPVYVMLLVVILAWVMINRTKFGRYIIAMGGNPEAARVSGVNLKKMIFGVFMCCGFCAGVAAVIMTGRTGSAQVSAGVGMEMDAIAAAVVGGTSMNGGSANIWGTLFGCLIVGVVNNGMNLMGINTNWQVIAKGALILLAVIIDVMTTRAQAARLNRQAAINERQL